jgi:hypothetical protein
VLLLENNALELCLEPLDCVLLGDAVLRTDAALALAAAGHTVTWPLQLNVKVHAKDTCRGIILDPEVDVLCDAKPKIACTAFGSIMFGSSWLMTSMPSVMAQPQLQAGIYMKEDDSARSLGCLLHEKTRHPLTSPVQRAHAHAHVHVHDLRRALARGMRNEGVMATHLRVKWEVQHVRGGGVHPNNRVFVRTAYW